MTFYIKAQGWIVLDSQNQILTTKDGHAEWSNNPFALFDNGNAIFESEEQATSRIKRIKRKDLRVVAIDENTPRKLLHEVRVSAYGVNVELYEIPIFLNKWNTNTRLCYDVKNVKKQAEFLRTKQANEIKKQIEHLQQQHAELEAIEIDSYVDAAIASEVENLKRLKDMDQQFLANEKKKEERKAKKQKALKN